MRFKIISAVIASAAFVPFLAQAEGLSYSYLEAGYLNTDLDESSETVGGWGLKGSWEFVDNWFAYGRYADQKTDVRGGEIKFQPWDIGLGYAWPLAEQTDIYGTVGYASVDLDVPTAAGIRNTNDDGYTLGAGIRTRFAESFEVEGTFKYQNLSDYGDEFDFGVQGRWYITDMFALAVGYNAGDETSTFYGGLRLQF
jgi:opacity protein-like surface antigen